MTNTNDADWQADWAIEIDRGRLALDGSLVDAINALTRAQQALTTFSSFDVAPDRTLTQQMLLGYIDRTRGTASLALS